MTKKYGHELTEISMVIEAVAATTQYSREVSRQNSAETSEDRITRFREDAIIVDDDLVREPGRLYSKIDVPATGPVIRNPEFVVQ